LLASLVEQRAGGQRHLPMAGSGKGTGDLASGAALVAASVLGSVDAATPAVREPAATGGARGDATATEPPALPGAEPTTAEARLPGGRGAERRPGRYGLAIQFEERPDDPELARLVESTVWINEAHPAYRRAAASRAEGYHIALASALALASLAVEPAKEHAFVTAFLASWGAALDRRKPARRR
jgi:hypothetical protein